MPGTDHILSKGLVVASSVTSPIVLGNPLVLAANTQVNSPGQLAQVAFPTAAKGLLCIGVAAENVDLVKLQTGKAFVAVNILGIAKVIADGAIAVNAQVTTSATTIGQVNGSPSAGNYIIGIALEAAVNQGDIIDVLLTPGVKF